MFPALQGASVSGKTMLWSIAVKQTGPHGMIITKRGYKDGKMQIDEKMITEGKNIGKKKWQ